MGIVIAIDGPAGAGKSSVARTVARRCGLMLVDTGAIYRTLALQARMLGISQDDEDGLAKIARSLPVLFVETKHDRQVLLDGEDVSTDIRTPEMSSGASKVSRHPAVRAALLELQRDLGRQGEGGVLEGRDIGTVVFPDADIKIFLTASAKERARRRAQELHEHERAFPFSVVLQEIRERDKADSEREVAPLKPADDAHIVESTTMTEAEVVTFICDLVETSTSTSADGQKAAAGSHDPEGTNRTGKEEDSP